MSDTDPKCVVCGEPAAGACPKCGLAYCAHHGADVTEGEEGPAVCWNCRATINAKAVLFWVTLSAAALGVILAFLSRWM